MQPTAAAATSPADGFRLQACFLTRAHSHVTRLLASLPNETPSRADYLRLKRAIERRLDCLHRSDDGDGRRRDCSDQCVRHLHRGQQDQRRQQPLPVWFQPSDEVGSQEPQGECGASSKSLHNRRHNHRHHHHIAAASSSTITGESPQSSACFAPASCFAPSCNSAATAAAATAAGDTDAHAMRASVARLPEKKCSGSVETSSYSPPPPPPPQSQSTRTLSEQSEAIVAAAAAAIDADGLVSSGSDATTVLGAGSATRDMSKQPFHNNTDPEPLPRQPQHLRSAAVPYKSNVGCCTDESPTASVPTTVVTTATTRSDALTDSSPPRAAASAAGPAASAAACCSLEAGLQQQRHCCISSQTTIAIRLANATAAAAAAAAATNTGVNSNASTIAAIKADTDKGTTTGMAPRLALTRATYRRPCADPMPGGACEGSWQKLQAHSHQQLQPMLSPRPHFNLAAATWGPADATACAEFSAQPSLPPPAPMAPQKQPHLCPSLSHRVSCKPLHPGQDATGQCCGATMTSQTTAKEAAEPSPSSMSSVHPPFQSQSRSHRHRLRRSQRTKQQFRGCLSMRQSTPCSQETSQPLPVTLDVTWWLEATAAALSWTNVHGHDWHYTVSVCQSSLLPPAYYSFQLSRPCTALVCEAHLHLQQQQHRHLYQHPHQDKCSSSTHRRIPRSFPHPRQAVFAIHPADRCNGEPQAIQVQLFLQHYQSDCCMLERLSLTARLFADGNSGRAGRGAAQKTTAALLTRLEYPAGLQLLGPSVPSLAPQPTPASSKRAAWSVIPMQSCLIPADHRLRYTTASTDIRHAFGGFVEQSDSSSSYSWTSGASSSADDEVSCTDGSVSPASRSNATNSELDDRLLDYSSVSYSSSGY